MTTNYSSDEYRKKLRDDLAEWRNTGQWSHYNGMRDTYKHLIKKVVESEDKAFEVEALNFFTPLCEETIAANENLYTAMVDNMLRVIRDKHCVDFISQQQGGDKALAWFVCNVSANCVRETTYFSDEDDYIQRNLARLLVTWSGKELPAGRLPTLDVVVTHIYGELCWEFLGSDVGKLINYAVRDKTLNQIREANLPLTFREKIINPASVPSNLPLDLSM